MGGIVCAGVGESGIPSNWADHIWEYPRSVAWMRLLVETVADALEHQRSAKPPTVNSFAVRVNHSNCSVRWIRLAANPEPVPLPSQPR